MSREISIVRKGFLGRNKVVRYERWDTMTQRDFTSFCAILRRSYFDEDGRVQMAEFIDEVKQSPVVVMRSIKVGRKRFYGPLSRFRQVTFGELVEADIYYDDYSRTKNEESLFKFIACLYRPKQRENGEDCRIPFQSEDVAKYAGLIAKKVDMDEIFAAMVNYSAVMEWLVSRYRHLFPPGEEGKKSSPGERGRSYIKMARAMASGKTDEDLKRVYDSYVSNVFDTLNEQIRDDKKKK